MNHPYLYIACFVPYYRLMAAVTPIREQRLEREILQPHVTVQYQPETVDERLFGENVLIRVTGYGCNGRNEGLSVQVQSRNPDLQKLLDRIAVPHITLSVARDGSSVDTRELDFHPVEPFTVRGRFGGCLPGRVVVTVPSDRR